MGLVPLLMHVAGWTLLARARWRRETAIGVLSALAMLAGNIGEFWIFSEASYTSAARNLSWTTFLLGTVMSALALILPGVRRLRTGPGLVL